MIFEKIKIKEQGAKQDIKIKEPLMLHYFKRGLGVEVDSIVIDADSEIYFYDGDIVVIKKDKLYSIRSVRTHWVGHITETIRKRTKPKSDSRVVDISKYQNYGRI